MFRARWTPRAKAQFEAIESKARLIHGKRRKASRAKSSRQEGLFKQVCKTLRLLLDNPRHPGLQTHEFTSLEHPFTKRGKVFEAYAQQSTPGAYRVFWCYGPGKGEIMIIAITPHP